MATTAVAEQRLDAFKSVLNAPTIRAQIKNSLKENAGAFMSSMIDLYNSDTSLQQCDPQRVALECLKAASLKLPINKALGFAYVVPYKNVPTFLIGYKGLIQLAQRSGMYRTINADIVYEGEIGARNKLTGAISFDGERTSDKVIGYFAYIELVNGFSKTMFMTKEEMDAWKNKYSKSANSSYSPWTTEYDKMAMKTVLRRLISTYGAQSTDMQAAMVDENKAEAAAKQDVSANANTVYIDPDAIGNAQAAVTNAPQNVDENTGELLPPPIEDPGF